MTNYERIKNMSTVELAKFINEVTSCCCLNATCENCPINCGRDCNQAIIENWLKSEVEE